MRWIAAAVIGLIVFLLATVCLLGAWFHVNGTASIMGFDTDIEESFGLRDVTARTEILGIAQTVTIAYSDFPLIAGTDFLGVLTITQILVILVVIFALLFSIFAILTRFSKICHKIGVVLGVLAAVFALITFVYFLVAFPPTLTQEVAIPGWQDLGSTASMSGLWGSGSFRVSVPTYGTVYMDVTWGPGFAWYLMFVIFLWAVIGAVLLIGAGRERRAVPVAPDAYQFSPSYYPHHIEPGPPSQPPLEEPPERPPPFG